MLVGKKFDPKKKKNVGPEKKDVGPKKIPKISKHRKPFALS